MYICSNTGFNAAAQPKRKNIKPEVDSIEWNQHITDSEIRAVSWIIPNTYATPCLNRYIKKWP